MTCQMTSSGYFLRPVGSPTNPVHRVKETLLASCNEALEDLISETLPEMIPELLDSAAMEPWTSTGVSIVSIGEKKRKRNWSNLEPNLEIYGETEAATSYFQSQRGCLVSLLLPKALPKAHDLEKE